MSLMVQPSALLTAFTSGSGIGSVQATRLLPDGLPLNRVQLSSGIRRSQASSPATPAPARAVFAGWAASAAASFQRSRAAPTPFRIVVTPLSMVFRPGIDRGSQGRSAFFDFGPVQIAQVAAIRHRQHDADKRHAIGDGVMEARDHRGAALVVLHDAHLPERARLVQSLRGEFGDVTLKFGLPALAWKPDALDVPRPVEIGIVDPPIFAAAHLDMLPQPGDGEETLGDRHPPAY